MVIHIVRYSSFFGFGQFTLLILDKTLLPTFNLAKLKDNLQFNILFLLY